MGKYEYILKLLPKLSLLNAHFVNWMNKIMVSIHEIRKYCHLNFEIPVFFPPSTKHYKMLQWNKIRLTM